MPQIDPQKNISFYYNFTSKFFESDNNSKGEFYCCENGDNLFILAPSEGLTRDANNSEDYNELSYVLLYQTSGKKIIFAGDSGQKTWDYILEKYKVLVSNVDVLLAPHHGRKTGENDNYLDILKPKLTLFGNAESVHLDYNSWNNRNLRKLTNNEAGTIVLDIKDDNIRVYIANEIYAMKFKDYEGIRTNYGYYIGNV